MDELRRAPIALVPAKPNEQHYEVPPEFFELVLGPRLKYSSCYWPRGVETLAEAEEAMLALTCERARIERRRPGGPWVRRRWGRRGLGAPLWRLDAAGNGSQDQEKDGLGSLHASILRNDAP